MIKSIQTWIIAKFSSFTGKQIVVFATKKAKLIKYWKGKTFTSTKTSLRRRWPLGKSKFSKSQGKYAILAYEKIAIKGNFGKRYFSWGKFPHTWRFTKTALKTCWCQPLSRKWWGPYGSCEQDGEKIFHKYLFVGIKSWWNEMSFKYKVFWINSKLSEARKVNLIILKIKLFSNTKCLKMHYLINYWFHRPFSRRKRRRKKQLVTIK